MSDIPLFPYPRSAKVARWVSYLGRNLTYEECSLLDAVSDEIQYNKELEKLYNIAANKGLWIPELTRRNGNCLFESLYILGVCENQDVFRKYLAYMMYLFRDHKNLFGYDDPRTLREMFNDTNEVEYVLCTNEFVVYKYTYETMCQDFASGFSWTRLPTQLIIQFISSLMNIQFEIFSNTSNYVNVLNANPAGSNPYIIYLGHLGENHYVPLEIRVGHPEENDCPKYANALRNFYKWAEMMEQSLNNVYRQYLEEQKLKNPTSANH